MVLTYDCDPAWQSAIGSRCAESKYNLKVQSGASANDGFFDPNRTIPRPARTSPPAPTAIDYVGSGSVEKLIPACVNASRRTCTVAAASGTSGIRIPHTILIGYTFAELTIS